MFKEVIHKREYAEEVSWCNIANLAKIKNADIKIVNKYKRFPDAIIRYVRDDMFSVRVIAADEGIDRTNIMSSYFIASLYKDDLIVVTLYNSELIEYDDWEIVSVMDSHVKLYFNNKENVYSEVLHGK